MLTDVSRLWFTRIVTFVISALAVASVVYWGLKVWVRPASLVAPAVVQQPASFDSQTIVQALGGGASPAVAMVTAAPAVSRFGLVGVVAGRLRAGAALISVDGQEPKPVRVGMLVDNEMVLESVNGRQAVLISSTGTSQKLVLEMPKVTN